MLSLPAPRRTPHCDFRSPCSPRGQPTSPMFGISLLGTSTLSFIFGQVGCSASLRSLRSPCHPSMQSPPRSGRSTAPCRAFSVSALGTVTPPCVGAVTCYPACRLLASRCSCLASVAVQYRCLKWYCVCFLAHATHPSMYRRVCGLVHSLFLIPPRWTANGPHLWPIGAGGWAPAFSCCDPCKHKVGVALFSLAPTCVHIVAENGLSPGTCCCRGPSAATE